jgi:hypothetical protein
MDCYAAVTRQDHGGMPPGGWYSEHKMSRIEALRSFTLDAAYAAFQEDVIGTLETGKWADFIMIDRDILKFHADPISGRSDVLQTWLAGRKSIFFKLMLIRIEQLNPIIGDLSGNTKLILQALEKAELDNIGLLILPEMVVTGYPAQDLLENDSFRDACYDYNRLIISRSKKCAILFGSIIPNESGPFGRENV